MSATSPAPLGLLRSIILSQFPWLTHVRKATDGGLSIKTAAALLHLMGDAMDPAAARVGDFCVRISYDGIGGTLYYSTSTAPPYAWTVVPFAAIPTSAPPAPTDAGVAVLITTGSKWVTCA